MVGDILAYEAETFEPQMMKCSKCKKEHPSNQIHLSHDVPCYLFFLEFPDRKGRKNLADKYGRRYLCKQCHDDYEVLLRGHFIMEAQMFAKFHFKEVDNGTTD